MTWCLWETGFVKGPQVPDAALYTPPKGTSSHICPKYVSPTSEDISKALDEEEEEEEEEDEEEESCHMNPSATRNWIAYKCMRLTYAKTETTAKQKQQTKKHLQRQQQQQISFPPSSPRKKRQKKKKKKNPPK